MLIYRADQRVVKKKKEVEKKKRKKKKGIARVERANKEEPSNPLDMHCPPLLLACTQLRDRGEIEAEEEERGNSLANFNRV